MASNIIKHDYLISRADRNRQNGHSAFVVWFTGLSGSGKSTIASHLEKQLFEKGIRTYSLDGDNIRSGLNKGLDFTLADRKESNRRTAEVAKLFMDAGLIAITAFISPLEEDRKNAREIIGKENFFEIFVNTPLEVCEERDVKGFYKKARTGEITNFTGIDSPYEIPENPDIEIKTQNEAVEVSVKRILQELEKRLKCNE